MEAIPSTSNKPNGVQSRFVRWFNLIIPLAIVVGAIAGTLVVRIDQPITILVALVGLVAFVISTYSMEFGLLVLTILNDEWIERPIQDEVKFSYDTVKSKAKQWINIIDGVIENVKDEDIDTVKELLKKYKEKKKYRTCGLEKEGEYSYESLVFKVLRRNGYIDKLYEFGDKFLDKKLSIK